MTGETAAKKRHLPTLQAKHTKHAKEGSLGLDGRRLRPYPADLSGRFLRARRAVYAALIALWAALPWVTIHGHPAVFLDIETRHFFLFGETFNAQDVWLLFFVLSGVGFGLVYLTMLLGRVWCGWACPQTVFLEAFFRPIERMFNGPRNEALKRAEGPFTFKFDRIWRLVATHAAYAGAALVVAHIVLAYFVSVPGLFAMVGKTPSAHPEAFTWMLAMTALMYGNFAFFREQLCVIVCPYGRLQSVLLDDDSLVVGYDEHRGEPRGKASKAATERASSQAPKGDCVACGRCVVVCPTGIDIREGLQLDCIACTACIDACDDVMTQLGRPRGLIRYDSSRGLRSLPGEPRRILRPRFYVYSALLVLGVIVASVALRGREPFEANLVRLPGAPYVHDGGRIRNAFELHVVNKQGDAAAFTIEAPSKESALEFIIPITTFELGPLEHRRIPVFVTLDSARFTHDEPFTLHVRERLPQAGAKPRDHEAHGRFLGQRRTP